MNFSFHPEAENEFNDAIHRSLVSRFPFGILYAIVEDDIFILAVMHLHKEPSYWKSRKQ
jgi:hypothetical protein